MTDGCAAQMGAGALDVGSSNCVLGTTLVLKGVNRELISDPAGIVYSHRSPDGNWLPGGACTRCRRICSRRADRRREATQGQQPLAERARRHAAPDTRAGQSRQDKRPRSSVRAGRIRLRLRRVREDAGRDNTRKLHESRMLYLRAGGRQNPRQALCAGAR